MQDLSKLTPPNSIEAEESLISTIIKDNDVLIDVVDIVSPKDFYAPANRIIFQTILDLYKKGVPVDLVTIADESNKTIKKEKGRNKKKGAEKEKSKVDIAYLAKVDSAPVAVDPVYYAELILNKSVLRGLIVNTYEISKRCFDEDESSDAVLDFAEQTIFDTTRKKRRDVFFKIDKLLDESIELLVKRKEEDKKITGISSGFTDLDKLTSGFQGGDLIILAARPSMGKTSLALNMARNAAVYSGLPVAVFSLEMPKDQLSLRLLSAESQVKLSKLRNGYYSDKEFKAITDSVSILSEYPIFIDDSVNITVMDIRSKVRKLSLEQKELGLIVIDYIQLMKTGYRLERRDLEIAEISKSLKNLAKELNVPILALSQLNRMLEQRTDKRPQLSDLRESGSLEQDADIVMFVYREDVYRNKKNKENGESSDESNDGRAELIVSKHRNGPIGTVHMNFLSPYTLFQNSGENYYE